MKHDPIVYTLPNGKSISLNWLYEEELTWLLRVPTTVEQAEAIKFRNNCLLNNLALGVCEDVYEGCPHCKTNLFSYSCEGCAWKLYSEANTYRLPCCGATFSGVTLVASGVSYGAISARIRSSVTKDRALGACAEDFLQGHVEWAEAVILMGGIPWPDGVLSALRRPLHQNQRRSNERHRN